jgi:hypothetical protein
MVLNQTRKGNLNQPIYFASRKQSKAQKIYITTKQEVLIMVYALQKFPYYLLVVKFYFSLLDHHASLYIVQTSIMLGKTQGMYVMFSNEFEFILQPGKARIGPNHFSQVEAREKGQRHGHAPNTQLCQVYIYAFALTDTKQFLRTKHGPACPIIAEKKT